MFGDRKSDLAAKTVAATLSLTALAIPQEACGSALKSLDFYDDSKALAAEPMFQRIAAIKRIDQVAGSPDLITMATGILIAPDLFITAGHFTPRNGSQVAELTNFTLGANYNQSSLKFDISTTQRYPGYVFGDATTIDFGVGWLSDFVGGFEPVKFGTIDMGEIGTMVDFGNYGSPSSGELPSLGDKMAGFAPRVTSSVSQYPESLYDFFNFNGIQSSSIGLNVQGLQGSSGSGWWNSEGELTHITIAGTNGTQGGYTVALELNNPAIQEYLQPLIADSFARYNAANQMPEPSVAVFSALGLTALAGRRYNSKK